MRILFQAPNALIHYRKIVIHRVPLAARLVEIALGVALVKLLNIAEIERFAFEKDVGAVILCRVPKRFVIIVSDRVGIRTKSRRRRQLICRSKPSAGLARRNNGNFSLVGITLDKRQLQGKTVFHAFPSEAVLLTDLRIGKT